jgi:hypothetical protein
MSHMAARAFQRDHVLTKVIGETGDSGWWRFGHHGLYVFTGANECVQFKHSRPPLRVPAAMGVARLLRITAAARRSASTPDSHQAGCNFADDMQEHNLGLVQTFDYGSHTFSSSRARHLR